MTSGRRLEPPIFGSAPPPVELGEEPLDALARRARPVWRRLLDNADAVAADDDQSEPDPATEAADPRCFRRKPGCVARRPRHREVNALADREPVDALEHQRERHAQLQFHDDRRRVAEVIAVAGDQIAAAHLALYLIAPCFEEALDQSVQRRFAAPAIVASACYSIPRPRPLAAREIQLDHHVVVVRKEQLVDRRLRDVVLAVLHILPFELGPDALKVGSEKREVIERAGVGRRAAPDRILARHEMDDRDRAAIEPVAREVEVRPEPDFKAENLLIEVASR